MADEVKKEEPVAEGAEKQPEAKKKKKKGKLPIIIVLLLVLGGGGFFMMKGKNAKPPEPKAPELGTIEPVKEMLINLNGGQYYLKIEISLHLIKDFKKEELEKNKEAIMDAMLILLKSKSLSDLQTPEQLRTLKKQLAAAVNAILDREKTETSKKDGGEGADKEEVADGEAAAKPAAVKTPEDYASAKGPVLKVYFTSFATQ